MKQKMESEGKKSKSMPQDSKMDKKHEMDPRKEMKNMNGMPMHTDPAHHIKMMNGMKK